MLPRARRRRRRRRPVSVSIRRVAVTAAVPAILLLMLLLRQLVFALAVVDDRFGRAVQVDVHRVQRPRECGWVRLRHGR